VAGKSVSGESVTGRSRREEYAAQTRAAVVSAAITRFAADGYAATTIDAIADEARVAKGGVYHHFASKAELFEAAFMAMETRLLERVTAGVAGITDPLELMVTGNDLYLAECSEPDFRRIALLDAPAAIGWIRWRAIEEQYFLALVTAGLAGLATVGYDIPPGDLAARMLLAAMNEAGLSIAASPEPDAERQRARAVMLRLLQGFRTGANG
jgi:AcrR family transcriptional regulator